MKKLGVIFLLLLVSLGLISCKKKYAKLTLPEHVYTNISNLNKVLVNTLVKLTINVEFLELRVNNVDVSGDNNLDYIDVTLKYKPGYEETKTLKEVIEKLDIDIEYPKTIEDEYILVTYNNNNNEYKLYVDIYDSELGASFITNAGIMYLNNLYSINDLFKGNKTYINPVGVLIDGHEYYSLEELKGANLNVETYNYNIIGAIPTVKEFIEVMKNDSFTINTDLTYKSIVSSSLHNEEVLFSYDILTTYQVENIFLEVGYEIIGYYLVVNNNKITNINDLRDMDFFIKYE